MNFSSDNAYGAAPEILAALSAAAEGAVPSYGADAISQRVTQRLKAIFECELAAFPVLTGTAANSLALATLCPPHGAILCHAQAHIETDECAAPEFFAHGAKVVALPGANGKLTPEAIEAALPRFQRGVHSPKPSAVSITSVSEVGTSYSCAEIAALADCAHRHGMKLHLDGARFANALDFLGCTPAEMTWKAGVDALSFGATKNGALGAEAVIFFDKADVRDFEYRRKKSGHLLSKMRFVSAQLDAYLANDLWRKNAAYANRLATELADGLEAAGIRLAYPCEGNQLFPVLPDATIARLKAEGAQFYGWDGDGSGHTVVRLVTAFATPQQDVARFLSIVRA